MTINETKKQLEKQALNQFFSDMAMTEQEIDVMMDFADYQDSCEDDDDDDGYDP